MRLLLNSAHWCQTAIAALALLIAASACAQEDLQWDRQTTGQTSVAKLGRVEYQISYRSAGFDHFNTEILIRWQAGQPSTGQQQILYEGIHDRPPARIWGAGRHLCLAMQTCARGSDHCQWHVLARRYQASSQRFVEVKPSSASCRTPR